MNCVLVDYKLRSKLQKPSGLYMGYYGVGYKGKGKRECPSVKQMMKD